MLGDQSAPRSRRSYMTAAEWIEKQLEAAPPLTEKRWREIARLIARRGRPVMGQIDRPEKRSA